MGRASVKATLVAGLISVIFILAIVLSGAPLWLRITGGAAATLVWWRYYYVTRTKYVIEERTRDERRSGGESDDSG